MPTLRGFAALVALLIFLARGGAQHHGRRRARRRDTRQGGARAGCWTAGLGWSMSSVSLLAALADEPRVRLIERLSQSAVKKA